MVVAVDDRVVDTEDVPEDVTDEDADDVTLVEPVDV